MCNSAVYSVNTTSQTVTSGNTVNFGSVVRRFGSNCNVASGNATISGVGYYDVDANIVTVASSAGILTATFYKDGVIIPGATQSVTVESGNTVAFNVPFIVRQKCCLDSTLMCVLNGVTSTVSNATITVEKL